MITFGSYAETLLTRAPVSASQKAHIRAVIQGLHVDGCTNMSAGLSAAGEVLQSEETTGLLLLTDGIANQGITSPSGLQRIVEQTRQRFPRLSVHCVGYGTDHNADLLRHIAEQNSGSYNIVNSVEDTAFAFGDTLGGLMSCVAQNVCLRVPANATVRGPWRRVGDVVTLGDVYASTKPTVLFTVPADETPLVVVTGVHIHEGAAPESFTETSVWIPCDRDRDLTLCGLRYDCSEILTDIQRWRSLTDTEKHALPTRINNLESSLQDTLLDGDALTTTLRSEIRTMRDQLTRAQTGHLDQEESVLMTQRSAYIGLGRGFSSPMAPRARAPRRTHWSAARSVQEDPTTTDTYESMAPPDESAPFVAAQAPLVSRAEPLTQEALFQNSVQNDIATLLRANSQGTE